MVLLEDLRPRLLGSLFPSPVASAAGIFYGPGSRNPNSQAPFPDARAMISSRLTPNPFAHR